MRELRILVRCIAQPKVHAKVVRVKAKLGRRKAEELAELLDGTSLAYVHPCGDNSPIGRCCACGSEVQCDVVEFVDGHEVAPSCAEAIEQSARKERKERRKLGKELGIA